VRVGRVRRLAAAATLAVAVAGCGLGPGERSEGEATLTVTRDYGAERLLEATVSDPSESETVIRFLDREAEITTRYGGAFVHSIDGLAGTVANGRSFHWFFYVDGLWSPVGSAEREVRSGHRIWWDYRDWTDAMRVPVVVGSWPEPLAPEASVECTAAASTCDLVAARLADAGVETRDGDGVPRVLVGPWEGLRDDDAAALLERGPPTSGVFARFAADKLIARDVRAEPAGTYRGGAGLVAAVRDGEDPPTWLVTGTDEAGVAAAAELLDDEHLEDRYAVATTGAEVVPLPVQ
jgi:hypothetical protein